MTSSSSARPGSSATTSRPTIIAPGRLFHLRTDLPELAKHVLEDARPEFAASMSAG